MKIKIDTPKWSFIKYNDDGSVDYPSPFPCPFNYGSILGTEGEDGDRLDAVVLGKKLGKGEEVESEMRAVVKFIDAGEIDPKYVFSDHEITRAERIGLQLFFRFFTLLKKMLNTAKRKKGKTSFMGIEGKKFID